MHNIQERLLALAGETNLGNLSYRKIGELLGGEHPQNVKHHLSQLEKQGLISIDKKKKIISRQTVESLRRGSHILSIPLVGSANCGPAEMLAEANVEGFLQISDKLLSRSGGANTFFAIRAVGESMNKAKIKGRSIDDGDYVIVDSSQKDPKDGDYVLSVIDDTANIKKFFYEKKDHRIVLLSESSKEFPPIYIHPTDRYLIAGKVVEVIKRPKFRWS